MNTEITNSTTIYTYAGDGYDDSVLAGFLGDSTASEVVAASNDLEGDVRTAIQSSMDGGYWLTREDAKDYRSMYPAGYALESFTIDSICNDIRQAAQD